MSEELARPEALAAAIELGQLRLFYHPIVVVDNSAIIGHEVLIRWQHPEHGLLAPVDFLPAINNDDHLSRLLGAWVLRQACSVEMQRSEQLLLSVNIAPRHLAESDFADHVISVLQATGLPADRLVLELTAASILEPGPDVVTSCTRLSDLGVTLALDDFGSAEGQLSADSLDVLPLGILKIDRSVTAGIGADAEAERLIMRTLEFASSTDLRTIAEGVESHDQQRFLQTYEATYAQGYLYGRPRPR
jgi:EAL domain-containing protein (putative c-di-GMP-specific phosphodiesterase class I)